MKRTTRSAVAITAAVAFGVTAPAASATPKDKPAHVKVDKTEKGKPAKAEKAGKASEKVAQAQRQVVRAIEKKDAALVRAVKDTRVSRLAVIGGADTKAAVIANVTADRAALADLLADVEAADSTLDLRQVREDLRQVRVENYVLVVNTLRQAAKIQAEIEAAGGNAEAAAALAAAVEKALAVTAASPKKALHAVRADLITAREALEAADEPVVDETPVA